MISCFTSVSLFLFHSTFNPRVLSARIVFKCQYNSSKIYKVQSGRIFQFFEKGCDREIASCYFTYHAVRRGFAKAMEDVQLQSPLFT